MDITGLSLALGSSFTTGLNLYLTLFSLGMMQRLDVFTLPPNMQILANPWALVCIGVLLIADFIADKFPVVDSIWDGIQGAIRIPAGVAIAATSFTDVPTHVLGLAGLAGGITSSTSFLANASTRAVVNTSPEPVSNQIFSLGKDGLVVSVLWFVANHPYVGLVSVLVLLAISVVVIYYFFRFLKRLFRRAVATAKNPRSLADKLPWRRKHGSHPLC